MKKTAISPTRAENYADWYQQVVRAADLAETSPVRGCMVIKPWGYRLWEILQQSLDQKFKATGHQNAYFPLFIPLSYLEKEAKHVEGFAKECAIVTHSRLQANDEGRLIPCSPLEEPLIVRPTSETIIGEAFSRWVQSYRDLPLLINQWANVVRWEMRTRLFLRTSEFLWQEGHTAHATPEEAMEETLRMLEIYRKVAEEELAIPVIVGEKPASERFPGADNTFTLEAMMQDGKALQLGTSHFLGQNFSRAMHIEFVSDKGQKEYAWTTSWGVTTRLIGALVMTHSDDDGLILPPRVAPLDIAVLPIVHDEESASVVKIYTETLCKECCDIEWHNRKITAQIDCRDIRGGEKRWHWIKKGTPIIVEVGKREAESGTITFAFRDNIQQRYTVSRSEFVEKVGAHLSALQNRLFERAKSFREGHSVQIETAEEFYTFFAKEGGFAFGFWSEDPTFEARIKEELKVTVRCLPLGEKDKRGNCIFTQKPNAKLAVFAKAY